MNEKQRDGMERAGETGDIIDRRAGERRAAAPVVTVVAAEKLEDSEQYRLQIAAICTAALGYWTESEGIKPEYDTPALRDVAKLYAKYEALASQAQAVASAPVKVDQYQWRLRWANGEVSNWTNCDARHSAIEAAKKGYVSSDGATYETRELTDIAGLAAQAAVGVASQQEQQQPSCMPPFAAPASQPDASFGDWISVVERLPEGRCIATYLTGGGKRRQIIATYVPRFTVKAEGDECYSETNDADDEEYLRQGWYECIDNWGDFSSIFVNEGEVTHWTPQPPTPEQSSTAGSAKGGITNNSGAASPDLASIASQAQGEALAPSSPAEVAAFEAWASGAKYNMETHPLHWLFLDTKTNAARQGWKAALRFARETIATPTES